MKTYPLWIGGQQVPGAEVVDVSRPYDLSVFARAGMADEAQLEAAVQATVAAKIPMARLASWQRAAILSKMATLITERTRELAEIIRDEAGKPIQYARGEVARAASTFIFAAEEAKRLEGHTINLDAVEAGQGRFGIVRPFPVGATLAVSPFNFPLNLASHKVAPAIAAGCPVLLKPASKTPLSGLMLAEIAAQAGLPEGGLNVVPCSRRVADPLTADPRFALLSFTGSVPVGWGMKARAGKKRVVLELGGDAPVIVGPDADLEAIIPRLAFGAFSYAGQVCISVQRIFVHESIADTFRARFVHFVREGVKWGDPSDPAVMVGPLIDESNVRRIMDWVQEARAGGARLLTGGDRVGQVVTPAVLEGVPPGCSLDRDEAFGPVVNLATFRSWEDVVEQANRSNFGLQAGVFTNDLKGLWTCYEGLDVGGVIHNDVPTFRVDHMPYGGVKDSGFGREGVRYALHDYVEPRLLALKP